MSSVAVGILSVALIVLAIYAGTHIAIAERPDAAAATYRRYGTPKQEPEFYRGLSARTYFDRITEPVLIHHGTLDDSFDNADKVGLHLIGPAA